MTAIDRAIAEMPARAAATQRTWTDGKPLYCLWCGDVFDNPDCESRCCELESEADAQARLHEMPAAPVAYYNENDPFAAAWLRNLIAAGHIAPGEVDERDIRDVKAGDLAGYTQCHFFAGIGGWSYALRLAGFDDARPVWTGSCPCQPFSSAGQGKAADDERHLWPGWFSLIRECRPAIVFGEQVEAAIGWGWLDAVFADMEAEGYACGASVLPACGVGAPHIRQRLWFVADADEFGARIGSRRRETASQREVPIGCGVHGRLADTTRRNQWGHGGDARSAPDASESQAWPADGDSFGSAGGLGDTSGKRLSQRERDRRIQREEMGALAGQAAERGSNSGHWSDLEWLPCQDGKWRPTKSGIQPLAHGVSARVGKLRAAGNAIVPQTAAAFIAAYDEMPAPRPITTTVAQLTAPEFVET